ncbi:hypothetical protein CHI95_05515 [Providencia rettgeri]|uniref:Uncharacterized protein n=1 Tax=Providencia rettgeri TaxID=587 RepID=A0A264VY68_PRORE|nr:hypothetical protein [Providencia rettgeri]OZS75737.1 hypothetical protein CHI95_05515 [Providencia rettgeri]
MDKTILIANTELSKCRDALHKIKALIVAVQFLNTNENEKTLRNDLLCVCEEEIDEALKDE